MMEFLLSLFTLLLLVRSVFGIFTNGCYISPHGLEAVVGCIELDLVQERINWRMAALQYCSAATIPSLYRFCCSYSASCGFIRFHKNNGKKNFRLFRPVDVSFFKMGGNLNELFAEGLV